MIVKPLDSVARKWGDVTPGRSAYFEEGVKTTPKDWAKQTSGQEKAWEQGVQAAIAGKRFSKGVIRVGDAKWRGRTLDVGVTRWGPGVSAAVDVYKTEWAPFHDELTKIVLPPKGARGDPANIERVKVIADRLHKKKLELLR